MQKIRIVSATTKDENRFWRYTLLGQSLTLFPRQVLSRTSITFNNSGNRRRGLSEIYNSFLRSKYSEDILLFVHDDVYLHDWQIEHRLNDAIERFDVVGLAGNTNPDFAEPSWALGWNRVKYPKGWQPQKYLSGSVGHTVGGKMRVCYYGPTPRDCQLLDGLFLAINTAKLVEKAVKFDEQFDFHFYDLDFCRECLKRKLKLGTWPISVTHASGGAYGSPEWESAEERYLLKWSVPKSR
jgi:hypothetical protein